LESEIKVASNRGRRASEVKTESLKTDAIDDDDDDDDDDDVERTISRMVLQDDDDEEEDDDDDFDDVLNMNNPFDNSHSANEQLYGDSSTSPSFARSLGRSKSLSAIDVLKLRLGSVLPNADYRRGTRELLAASVGRRHSSRFHSNHYNHNHNNNHNNHNNNHNHYKDNHNNSNHKESLPLFHERDIHIRDGESPAQHLLLFMVDLKETLANATNRIMTGLVATRDEWELIRESTWELGSVFRDRVVFDWENDHVVY